jgi:hypothetical protein
MDDNSRDPSDPVIKDQETLLQDDDKKHQAVQSDQEIGEQDAILGGAMPVTGADYDLDDERAKMGLTPQDPEHPTELNSQAELEALDSNDDNR